MFSGDSLGYVRRDTWLLPFGSPPRFSLAPLAPADASAGDSLRIALVASNPFGAAQPFTFSLNGTRAWPGWPASALVRLAPGASDTVRFAFAVPETATAGTLAWTAKAAWRGGAGIADSCTATAQVAGTVSVAADVAQPPAVVAFSDVVTLTWQTTLGPRTPVEVQVARDGGPWATVATVTVDANGRCTYADHTAAPGTDCSYRLATTVNGVRSTSAPVTVNVPAAARFALQGFRPNPSHGAPVVAFGLARRGPARLEVFDLAGRRVWAQAYDELPPGPHLVPLDPGAVLRPGLVFIRLTQGGRTLGARGIVVR